MWTYVRRSSSPLPSPPPPLAHSAVKNTDALPAHTLKMEERRTLSPTHVTLRT